MTIGLVENVVAEAALETIDSRVRAIVGNWQWVAALDKWYRAGGRPKNATVADLDLDDQSWLELQAHLCGTSWFTRSSGTIKPNASGQDFLTRIDELFRAELRQELEDKIVGDLLAKLPLGGAVDIGCGPGHSTLRLARLGFMPLYAYDLSPVAIAIARALLSNDKRKAHLHAGEATSLLEVERGSLALVFSRGALHYFGQADLAETLRQKLQPGGYLVAEIVGLRYYLQRKHIASLVSSRWRQPISYGRTILRTIIYEAFTLQPQFAAGAPEIGYTLRSIRQLARWAGLDVLTIGPAPSSVGYLVVMRKPLNNGD